MEIFTIGHSTRSIEEFLILLREPGIETVADIRSFPGSRKFPHFGQDRLKELLAAENIQYAWYKDLGGFRKKTPGEESPNTGLSSPGFRNYADYMATDTFRAAVSELVHLASRSRTTVMCAERLFWKCHRRILSDYLVTLDVEVFHILEQGKIQVHTLTPGAVKTREGVIYPDDERLSP
ncbi:MAG: DUF488 domain-containing protein [Desulfobacterales bacterium]|nr:DUF488 domain-containing protein [Desulfobacterales bacterium]